MDAKMQRKERILLLYHLYEKPMYHIAYAILHHPQQAEDAVSEAFCYLLRHLDKFDEPESARTKQYIIRLIRSRAIDQYRKNAVENGRRAPWDERVYEVPETEDQIDSLEQSMLYTQQQAALEEMLGTLSETDSRIVLMHCVEGLTFREIAERMSMKENTVRKRFERARKSMMRAKGVTRYAELFSV